MLFFLWLWIAMLLCVFSDPLISLLRHVMGWQPSSDEFFQWSRMVPEELVLVGFDADTYAQWLRVANDRGVHLRALSSSSEAPGDVMVCVSRADAATQRAAAPGAFLFSCSNFHGNRFWEHCDGAVSKCAEIGVDEAIRLYGRLFEACQLHIETIGRLGKLIDPLDGMVLVEQGRAIVPLLVSASMPVGHVPVSWHFQCNEVFEHFEEHVKRAGEANAACESIGDCNTLHAVGTECLKRLMLHLRKNKSLLTACAERGH